MTDRVISANRLGDGIVVYLTADGGWSERIARARLIDGGEAGAAALDGLSGAAVVDPYLIDISGGDRRPILKRERIRARGPTVRLDLGKQAAR